MRPRSRLANEFFQVVHHDVRGELRLPVRTCAVGLAAALLGELIFDQRIVLHGGLVRVCSSAPVHDDVGRAVLAQIVAEPEHRDVRVRLESLSVDAYDLVAHRLWQQGAVRRTETRRLFGRSSVEWMPTDWNTAAWSHLRLRIALERKEPLDDVDVVLAELATAAGLTDLLLSDIPAAAAEYLHDRTSVLHPALRELIAHTTAAFGNSVLTYRT